MLRTRTAPAALALAVTALVALALPASAAPSAEPRCVARTVVDRADILDDAAVEAAALDVDQATVKVVTFPSVPGEDLDSAVDDFREKCDAFGATSLVLAISVGDRVSGVYYGGALADALGGAGWEEVNSAMQRSFPDDFTGGVVQGLATADRLISDPGGASGGPTDGPTSGGGLPPAEPVDVAWGWVLGVPAGGAALIGGGVGAVRLRRRLKARSAARAAAASATSAAAGLFLEIESAAELVAARVAHLPQVRDVTVLDLRERGGAVAAQVEAAMGSYMAHTEKWPVEAIEGASLEEAGAAGQSAGATHDQLVAATAAVTELDERITGLEQAVAETPALLAAVEADLRTATELADGLDADGYFTTTHRAEAAAIAAEVAKVREAHAADLWGEALERAAVVRSRTSALVATEQGLRERRGTLVADIATARARHDSLVAALTDTDATVSEIAGTYHSETVEVPRSAAERARDAHAAVPELLASAEAATGMAEQRFDDADSDLAEARGQLDVVDRGVADVAAAQKYLVELTAALPGRVRTQEGEIAAMAQEMEANRAAVGFLDSPPAPDALRARAQEAAAELAEAHPRLLTLDTALATLGEEVVGHRRRVQAAVTGYNEAVRLIDRARDAVRDARAASSRANSGSTSTATAGRAAAALEQAELLHTAPRSTTVELSMESANQAIRLAREAESQARQAISAHNAEESRRRAAASRARSSSSGSSSSSRSFSSSRSSGSRSGGGGSRSFGGGSRRSGGGGSSKW